MTARMCALHKAYNGERAWKYVGHRLQAPYYWSRVDHFWKIIARKIRRDIVKFSNVNTTNADLNRLPEGATGNSSVRRIYSEREVGK
jgi:hypothetical protein